MLCPIKCSQHVQCRFSRQLCSETQADGGLSWHILLSSPGGESMREASPILRLLAIVCCPEMIQITLHISLVKGNHTATSNFKLVGYFNSLLAIQYNHQILLKPLHNSREATNYIFLESSFRKQERIRGHYSLEVITSTQVSRCEIHSCFLVRIENNHYTVANWHSGGRFLRNSFKKGYNFHLVFEKHLLQYVMPGVQLCFPNLMVATSLPFHKNFPVFCSLITSTFKINFNFCITLYSEYLEGRKCSRCSIEGPWAHIPCALLVGM